MKHKHYSTLLCVFFIFGCGDSESPSTKETPKQKNVMQKNVMQNDAEKKNTPDNENTSTAIKAEKTPKKPLPNASFDPLKGKTLFDICKSSSLSLIKWSYAQRQSQTVCCSENMTSNQKEELLCELDWPSSDIPSCSSYDTMRNEIYAQYGRSFSTEKWQKYFSTMSWYKPKNDYQDSWLSDAALENVKLLVQMKKEKQGCMD